MIVVLWRKKKGYNIGKGQGDTHNILYDVDSPVANPAFPKENNAKKLKFKKGGNSRFSVGISDVDPLAAITPQIQETTEERDEESVHEIALDDTKPVLVESSDKQVLY